MNVLRYPHKSQLFALGERAVACRRKMAAYGSLISLSHLIEQVLHYNARKPIFRDEFLRQLQVVCRDVSFVQDFLESYSGTVEMKGLESRIVDAAYAAQDAIDSHVLASIRDPSHNSLS